MVRRIAVSSTTLASMAFGARNNSRQTVTAISISRAVAPRASTRFELRIEHACSLQKKKKKKKKKKQKKKGACRSGEFGPRKYRRNQKRSQAGCTRG